MLRRSGVSSLRHSGVLSLTILPTLFVFYMISVTTAALIAVLYLHQFPLVVVVIVAFNVRLFVERVGLFV